VSGRSAPAYWSTVDPAQPVDRHLGGRHARVRHGGQHAGVLDRAVHDVLADPAPRTSSPARPAGRPGSPRGRRTPRPAAHRPPPRPPRAPRRAADGPGGPRRTAWPGRPSRRPARRAGPRGRPGAAAARRPHPGSRPPPDGSRVCDPGCPARPGRSARSRWDTLGAAAGRPLRRSWGGPSVRSVSACQEGPRG
jgi:hypothetical protein